jgi:hypothetical protein
MTKNKRIVVSDKLQTFTDPAQMKRYADEIKLMFVILPHVCKDFNVPKPSIEFKWSGKRNGTYHYPQQIIDISPKPWHGSVIDTFIHEMAHHVQYHAGRLSPEFVRENFDYDKSGGHGLAFYDILSLVVDHFIHIYGWTYNWTKEYDHIQQIHNIMLQSPNVIPHLQLTATMQLFGCGPEEATTIINQNRPPYPLCPW